jgi:hypothetical protein
MVRVEVLSALPVAVVVMLSLGTAQVAEIVL